MRRLALVFTLAFLPLPALAQTPLGRLDFHLQTAQGQAVSGATVNVYLQPSVTTTLTISTVQILAVPFIPSPYYALVTFTADVPAYAAGQSYRFSGLTSFTALNGLTLSALPYAGTPGPRTPNITPASNQALFLFGSTPYGPAADTGSAGEFASSACGNAKGLPATLYTTALAATVLPQPVTTSGFGEATAYVTQGCYTVVYYSPYTGTLTYADQSAIPASNVTAGVGAGCSSGVCTIPQGGTNATTQAAAFNSVVAPGGDMTGPFTAPTSNGIINAERWADLPTAFAQLSPTERQVHSACSTYTVNDTDVLPSTLTPTLTSVALIGSNRDCVIIKAGRNVIKTTADVTVGAAPSPNQMWVATPTDAADLSIGVPINLAGADTAGGMLSTVSNGYLVGALRTATYVSGLSACPISSTQALTFAASSTGRIATGSIAIDGSGNPGAVTWTSPFGNGGGYSAGTLTGTATNCTGTGTFTVTTGNLVVLMKPAVTTVTGAALTAPLVLIDANNRAVIEHITLDADGYPAVIGMNFHTDAKFNDMHFMGGFAAPLQVAANSGTGAYTGGVTTGSFYTTLKGISVDGNCDNTRTLASDQVFPVGTGSTGCTSGVPTSRYALYDVSYGGNPPSGVGWNALIKVEGNFKCRNTLFACAYNSSGGILELDQFDGENTPGWGIYNQYGTIKQKNGDNEQNKLGPVFINPWVPVVNAASSIDGNAVLAVAKTSYVPGSVLVTAGSNQVTFANPTLYAVGVGSVIAVNGGAAWNFSGSVPPTDPWGVASSASPSSTAYEVVTASGSLSSMTVTSGGTSCTNGTQTITGTATGVQVPWVGTVLVTANAPGGAVTLTNNGSGYNSVTATGSFTGKVATCTGNTTVSASVGITMATAATVGNGGLGGTLYGPITANYNVSGGAPASYTQVWKTESQQFYESPVIRRGVISGTTRIMPSMGTDSATWYAGQSGIPLDSWIWANEDGATITNTASHPGNTGLTTATYVSGLSACTAGTNVVTFTGTGSGAKGTIVTTTVPAAAAIVTMTRAGWNYTGTTATATVATCTGTGTFNIEQGGTFTAPGGGISGSRVMASNGTTGPAITLAVASDGSETQLVNTLASGTTGFVPMSLETVQTDGSLIFKNLTADNTDGTIILPHLASLTSTKALTTDSSGKIASTPLAGTNPLIPTETGTFTAGHAACYNTSSGDQLDCASSTLPNSISGTAAKATNLAGGAIGSLPYQSAANTTLFVAGNTAATDQVLTSTGTGAAAQAPTLTNAPALSAANMTNFPTVPLAAGLSTPLAQASGGLGAAYSFANCAAGLLPYPCYVYQETEVTGEGTAAGGYSTRYTTTAAGVYKITGYIYTTTVSSTAYNVGLYAKAACNGGAGGYATGLQLQATIPNTPAQAGGNAVIICNLASSTAIQSGTISNSGANTGGVWSHAVMVERLK